MSKRTPTPPPATPREGSNPVSGARNLLSTPSNCGSDSEICSSASVRDVTPRISADIARHDRCTVDNLLNGMLSLCLPEEHKRNPPADLLKQCLDAVLHICNGQKSPIQNKGKQQKRGENLRGCLTNYLTECRTNNREDKGYMPLVQAFNHALRALREIDVPLRKSTRKSTDLLLFHRNDPKDILSTQDGRRSRCKPDIVLVSLGAAKKDASSDEWDDYAFEKAGEPPENNFEWGGCLSAVEIKWTRRQKRKGLPDYDAVKPVSLNCSLSKAEDGNPRLPNGSRSRSTSQSRPSLTCTFSGRKRKSEQGQENPTKKRKVSSEEADAMNLSALYAAERMSDAIWVSHAINLVIIDTVAYVWWYDNEGVIQSDGIDFVEDLPYFLVLLLCFERFTPKNWGIVSELISSQEAKVSFPPSAPLLEISIGRTIRGHYGIVGRATRMLEARSQSNDPRNPAISLEGTELVLKVYWAEALRASEVEIIAKADEIAQRNDDVKGHLPDLIYSHDFVEYSTKEIRTAFFGIETETKSTRVLRVILFRRLYPITDLTGDDFWRAFWECFRCHYHLWVGGVQHNDVSVKNLMYDRVHKVGILNDYDLAHLNGRTRPSGAERTGTMPFMALELLTDSAWNGHVERQYCHDCESFAWVLLWICCRYDDGKEIDNPPLSDLITDTYQRCYQVKATVSQLLKDITPTPSYERFWKVARGLIKKKVLDHHVQNFVDDEAVAPQRPINEEEDGPLRVFESYRKVVEEYGFSWKDFS